MILSNKIVDNYEANVSILSPSNISFMESPTHGGSVVNRTIVGGRGIVNFSVANESERVLILLYEHERINEP